MKRWQAFYSLPAGMLLAGYEYLKNPEMTFYNAKGHQTHVKRPPFAL